VNPILSLVGTTSTKVMMKMAEDAGEMAQVVHVKYTARNQIKIILFKKSETD
jgi:hypothetical protein